MIGNARGSHSSPGIYTKEVDLSYAAKSLGITTLGVVGETLKGPAFEPIKIENWNEFVNYFGGTSAEKFSGSQYPKYELPYIAKSYLKNSNQLEVCRVLGLSGYNAGPAWLITAQPSGNTDVKYVVAVLRSRGSYDADNGVYNACSTAATSYDKLTYFATGVTMEAYASASISLECNGAVTVSGLSGNTGTTIDAKVGKFTLVVSDNKGGSHRYPVSLNAADKDYILNVLGSTPSDGIAPIFVEELYDVAFNKMVEEDTVHVLSASTIQYGGLTSGTDFSPIVPNIDSVYGILDESVELGLSHVGLRFLAATGGTSNTGITEGNIYEVTAKNGNNGRTYEYEEVDLGTKSGDTLTVYVISKDKLYQSVYAESGRTVSEIGNDVNNYKEQFRCASTPWVVSELKGDGKVVEVRKLFRFHTISDGNVANEEVKVSIQNIRPDEGTFDVIVRAFDDMDSTPTILERYTKCNMVPGTNGYIGLKIGTFDGEFTVKSKYITVEVNANESTESCIPAGFLGYPMRDFGTGFTKPTMGYNTMVDGDIKAKRQYFGFSNITGIDVDLFKYKGKSAYNKVESLSEGFHLDSRIETLMSQTGDTSGFTITVDGVSGFTFQTVSPQNKPSVNGGITPKIGLEEEMVGTIYEDVNLRKFTVCFYGGFDGWDPYRSSRTNSDKFKANKYKGSMSNGFGGNFSMVMDPESLNLEGNCITTDYYAYLAGARQFANPEAVDINLFATPGIDYVNNTMLSQEILDMIEDEYDRRGDALYIMTTPDKPFGNYDSDMYYPDEAVSNLEDTDIDSSYAATYYPWVKYYDADNKVYINLPATKDVVSAMAYTDNVSYPWFAPAGTVRGSVDCERAHYITKLEDEDVLYDGRINPIKTFAVDGVKIWGQKTMSDTEGALNRINVRRLMIRVKKLINGACRRLIFEQNDAALKMQFEGLVKPILDDIKSKRGVYDYKLEIDQSPEAIDRHELNAAIHIKPTKTLEYIGISFILTPSGVSFSE